MSVENCNAVLVGIDLILSNAGADDGATFDILYNILYIICPLIILKVRLIVENNLCYKYK